MYVPTDTYLCPSKGGSKHRWALFKMCVQMKMFCRMRYRELSIRFGNTVCLL